MISKALNVLIWLIVIPFCVGLLPAFQRKTETTQLGTRKSLGYTFSTGYILMWAVFQMLAVPFVLKELSFYQLETVFESLMSALALAGILLTMWKTRRRFGRPVDTCQADTEEKMSVRQMEFFQVFFWAVFGLLLLFQVYQSYSMAYADGDDAYYLPLSSAANLGGSMYRVDSYTGAPTTLDMRHGLAPFPMWISFIASKCGVNAAVAAQTLVPLVLIPVTYLIYLEIGRILCREHLKALPIFMIFISLLQIFGNYSIYPASTFLLTRTRQGKEALGNIIIPFLFLILLEIAEKLKENQSLEDNGIKKSVLWKQAAILVAVSFAGCLCSTMSTFLIAMLVMLVMLLLTICYKNWKVLAAGFAGILPCIVYALLYFQLK